MTRWIVLGGVVAIATIGYYATVYPSDGLGRRNVYAIAATLQQKADAALARIGAQQWARADVNGQTAVLMGEAPTDSDRQDAVDAVKAAEWSGGKWVGGITVVRSIMTVAKPVSPYEWTAVSGATGRVRLSGLVPGQKHRRAILAEAKRFFPTEVDDQMKIAQGAPTGPWTDTAIWALSQLSRLSSGDVRFKDKTILLRGSAPNESVATDIANGAATKVGKPYKGDTDLRIAEGAPPSTTGDAGQAAPSAPAPQPAPAPSPPSPPVATLTAAPATPGPATPAPATAAPAPEAVAPPPATPTPAAPQPGTTALAQPETPTPGAQHDDGMECQKLVDKLMTNNTIAFAAGSAEVRSVANEMLNHLAQSAGKCPLKIRITGHVDTSPAEAADPNLSQERADAVAAYLMRRGVSRKRISAVGAGTEQPVGDNATPAGQAKNRRIEITVTN